MPRQLPDAVLSPLHEGYRQDLYDAYEPDQFIELVCNQGMVLPEDRAGNQRHLPCCWLGDDNEAAQRQSLHRSDVEDAIRARLGWREAQVLLVLPSPSEEDFAYSIALSRQSREGRFLRDELARAGIPLASCVATHVCRFELPRTVRQYRTSHKIAGLPYLQADIAAVKPDVIICCGAVSYKALYGRTAKLDNVRGDVLHYVSGGRRIPVIPTVSHLAFIGGHANLSVFRQELRRAMEIANRLYSQKQSRRDYRICHTADSVSQLCREIAEAQPEYIAFDTEWGNDVARDEFSYPLSVQLAWGVGKAAFIQLRDQQVLPPPPVVSEVTFKDWLFDEERSGYKRPEQVWSNTQQALEADPEAETAALRKYWKWNRRRHVEALGREGFDYHYLDDQGARWKCGVPIHSPEDEAQIWTALQLLLLDRRWKIVAHHLRVDCQIFEKMGYSISERIEDGIDTMLIHHLLYGDENQGLDHLVRKYVPEFGAYWMDLEEWLDTHRRSARLRFGYRDIPLTILTEYALIDADAAWQIVDPLLKRLDDLPELRELYWRHVAPTSLHLFDVEQHGILIDEQRRTEMREAYEPVFDEMLRRVREKINWPGFNPRSRDQMASLLFSDHNYRDKKSYKWSDGSSHWLPEGVNGLHLDPILNTDKYPKDWEEIELAGEEELHAPSTKATTLELLYQRHKDQPLLRQLKHLSVVGKFLTSYLAPQEVNEFGVVEDGDGFHNNIQRDGRVRTHLSQLTQTGRYTSSKANLQTKPKRQEAAAFEALVDFYFGISIEEYEKRTFDGKRAKDGSWAQEPYAGDDRIEPKDRVSVPKFATCFIAPKDYVLIEADFKTAELAIWAYCSGDRNLIAVIEDGRDMHSEVAATAFKLPEGRAPLTDALAALGAGDPRPYDAWAGLIKSKYGALRVAAKTVNFGVMYGRGARALTNEINKVVGEPITVEDAQKIIDGVAATFPAAWQWLVDNSEFAVENGWIADAFGRRRWFQGAAELADREQAAISREAKNSPIQGAVADLLARAGYMLYFFLTRTEVGRAIDMRILLPVHDAFLFEVHKDHLRQALRAIKVFMSLKNTIPGTDGKYLGLDVEVMRRSWGDKGVDPFKPGALKALEEELSAA